MTQFIFQNSDQREVRKKLRNNATETEQILWQKLRKRGVADCKFIRQYSVGKYVLDFYCPEYRLGIEVDGAQHDEEKNRIYDEKRTAFIAEQGIKIIRFWNSDVFNRLDAVCDEIFHQLELQKKESN